jgi:hypothetical protein
LLNDSRNTLESSMDDELFRFSLDGGLGLPCREGEPPMSPSPVKPNSSDGDRFRQQLRASPALCPIAIDPQTEAVQFVSMTSTDYSSASFHDSRMLTPNVVSEWRPWSEVRKAAEGLPVRCHFIFHISHVGSTLLSRLLGQHSGLFSLREPAILRGLADRFAALDQSMDSRSRAELDNRLTVFLALWSRTFEREQTSLIKATSFVGEMSELLLQRVPDSRSILMFVSPRTFLQALLDGAMSDINGQAAKRLARLHRRLGKTIWRLGDLSAGEAVAMSWLCEMLALRAAVLRFPDRVHWLDFDRFLKSPEPQLTAALDHIGVAGVEDAARIALSGPIMGQYAKAPAHSFNARVREQLLVRSELRHAAEIERGLAWLDRAAAEFPDVGDVIEISKRGHAKS